MTSRTDGICGGEVAAQQGAVADGASCCSAGRDLCGGYGAALKLAAADTRRRQWEYASRIGASRERGDQRHDRERTGTVHTAGHHATPQIASAAMKALASAFGIDAVTVHPLGPPDGRASWMSISVELLASPPPRTSVPGGQSRVIVLRVWSIGTLST